jgi:hypothetical protein
MKIICRCGHENISKGQLILNMKNNSEFLPFRCSECGHVFHIIISNKHMGYYTKEENPFMKKENNGDDIEDIKKRILESATRREARNEFRKLAGFPEIEYLE